MAHPSPVRVPLSRHERVVQSHRPEFLRRIGEPDILAAIKEATGKPVATEKLKVKSKQLLRTGLFKTCKARCSPIGCKRTVKACNQRFSHRPAAFTNSSGIFKWGRRKTRMGLLPQPWATCFSAAMHCWKGCAPRRIRLNC